MVPLLAVAAIVLVFAFIGYRVGLVRRVVELVGLVVSILVAARLASGLVPTIEDRIGLEEGPALLVAFVTLVFAGLLLSRVAAWLVSRTVHLTVLGWLDRWGGAAAGAAMGWLLCSVFLVALTQVPGGDILKEEARDRPVLGAAMRSAPALYLQLRRLFSAHGDEIWERVLEITGENAAIAGDEDAARHACVGRPTGGGAGA